MGKYNLQYSGQEIDDILGIAKTFVSGMILMWSGSIDNIPEGWVLCDGSNDTPDLRNRFIVGAGGEYAVNDIGGSNSVTLTTSQIPSHTHTAKYSTDTTKSGDSSSGTFITTISQTSGSRSFTTETAGGGTAHENRPPYYSLAYIMKI